METKTPTTLEGLKRTAWQLKKQTGVPHHAALEVVARNMGYRNYQEACKQLKEKN